jgi:C-terminal processing protease CtpA/Prc
VHTVKKGSSLEGHIFAGDLIISVDNVDTRSYSAEQVMKMMTAKTRFERKITVLHFDTSSSSPPPPAQV